MLGKKKSSVALSGALAAAPSVAKAAATRLKSGVADVTQSQGSADTDLSTAAQHLDAVVRAGELGYVVTGKDGRITALGGDIEALTGGDSERYTIGNPMVYALRGLALTDMDGNRLDLETQVMRSVEHLCKQGKARRLSILGLRSDGGTLHLESWFPGDGTFITVARDVSDVARDRAMLETTVAQAGAGYWSMDLQTGDFVFSNSVNARLSDTERERIASNGLFAIIHKDDVTRMAAQWQDVVAGLGTFDLTYRVITEADGIMWQRSTGRVETARDGTRLRATAFVMDITADMEARADLEELQSVSRAKEDFMARMSHEIRTPLNAIIGMASSLEDEPMSDTVREIIGDMEQSAENLHGLLTQTLDHAKLDSGSVIADFDPIDPRELLAGCVRTWRARASKKGLLLKSGVGPNVPSSVPLDAFRIRQCLDNLLSNALKFTESGQIVVAARQVERDGAPHVAFIVQDTGIGMSEAARETVFDAYTQADGTISRRFGGTGLGLSICRQLSVLMGGNLSVRSEEGKGSAFVLMLPCTPPAKEAPKGTANAPLAPLQAILEDAPRLPFEGLSVLCVEDNPINQKVVERLIGNRVSQLHFASHGKEALAVLNTVHVDVVLMDIHMPIMDGIETTLEIRKSGGTYANVIIIALTADPDYQQMRICRNIGMNDTIAKPVRREDILEAFNRTMGSLSQTYGTKVALG